RRHDRAAARAEGAQGAQARREAGRARRGRGGSRGRSGRRSRSHRRRGARARVAMLAGLANAWRVPELRRRVLLTAGIPAVYRLGSWIPAPGVDQTALQNLFNGGGILTLLNLFSGSALSRFSLFALGIMPYVTASIIIQLLTVVIPTL